MAPRLIRVRIWMRARRQRMLRREAAQQTARARMLCLPPGAKAWQTWLAGAFLRTMGSKARCPRVGVPVRAADTFEFQACVCGAEIS